MNHDPAVRQNLEHYLTMVRERHALVGRPVTHENGFIQVPVGQFARLHVWSNVEIQKQRSDSPIHDHTFSLRSWVLYGRLTNVLVAVQEQPTDFGTQYEIHHVSPQGRLVPTGTYASTYPICKQSLYMGSVYEMTRGFFHETAWEELAVSLMVKTAKGAAAARVLHPHAQVVDNEFDREEGNDEALLWAIVDRGVGSAIANLDVW